MLFVGLIQGDKLRNELADHLFTLCVFWVLTHYWLWKTFLLIWRGRYDLIGQDSVNGFLKKALWISVLLPLILQWQKVKIPTHVTFYHIRIWYMQEKSKTQKSLYIYTTSFKNEFRHLVFLSTHDLSISTIHCINWCRFHWASSCSCSLGMLLVHTS